MGVGGQTARGNLPAELTSFVGRRRLLQAVKSGLTSARLLTLVGPGGVGKTRLALRAATDLQRGVADGVWLVELAGLREAELVPKAVMTALGLRDQAAGWTVSRLVDFLRARRVLLILDNCEHLVDACAVLADTLLREAHELRILATSRQPLDVPGERVLQVAPLGLPEGGAASGGDAVLQSDAVALLVERAAAATGDFALSDDNVAAVVELVRRLDGMPLAIELAAGRLRALGIRQIVDRLDDRFRLLSGGPRTAPERQTSLRAAIDWSFDLLAGQERATLCRLALFRGSFGLDGAEAVGTSPATPREQVADVLGALVDRSFVTRAGTSTEARYRLHETMREYALGRLRESDDEAAARQQFLDFYTEAVQQYFDTWTTTAVRTWFPWIEGEMDNVRAVLDHCLTTPAERRRGLRIVGQLGWYMYGRATTEGMYWLDRYLESPGDDEVMAQPVLARALLTFLQSDLDGAVHAATDAADRARRCSNDVVEGQALTIGALAHAMAGDFDQAREAIDEALVVARRHDDPGLLALIALAQGLAALTSGDAAAAYPIYQQAADLCQQHGIVYALGHHLGGAGMACVALGRFDEARRLLDDAVRLARDLDDPGALIFRIEDLVCLAAAAGQPERAARLSGVTATLLREIGGEIHPPIRARLDQAEQRARTQLGEARFERARREGEALDRHAAIALALEERPAAPEQRTNGSHHTALGKREREVAEMVADGLSNKEIAARLFLSERTVETHVYNILNKLGFNSRVQIASWVSAGR